jgi:hypothetical protein
VLHVDGRRKGQADVVKLKVPIHVRVWLASPPREPGSYIYIYILGQSLTVAFRKFANVPKIVGSEKRRAPLKPIRRNVRHLKSEGT